MSSTIFYKDPDAILDYVWDWSTWLPEGDIITSATATASNPASVTVGPVTFTDDKVIVWLSGGTVGEDINITVRITTMNNRTDERTAKINIKQR